MDMFDEISKVKKDLPRFKTVSKEVSKYTLNSYQKFAIITYIICLFMGIVLGNLFPACGSSSSLYAGECMTNEFNFSLMIFVWFVSIFPCLFIFAIGHIVLLLTNISEKLSKLS